MPIANIRNDQQGRILASEFVRRSDHLYTSAMLLDLFRSMFAVREFWLYNQITRQVGTNIPTVTQAFGLLGNMAFTASNAAIATVSPASVIRRRGHGGIIQMGASNNVCGYTSDQFNARVTAAEPEIVAADRGLFVFAAMGHPAGYAVPTAGWPFHAIVTKWGAANQLAYILQWEYQTITNPAGEIGLTFACSNNGANVQAWYFTQLAPVAGAKLYMVGACFVPSVGCYGFVNDEWQFKGNADFTSTGSVVPMAAVFQGTSRLCVARRDDAAGANTNQHPDAYWQFAGIGAGLVTPDTWLSLYRFCQPMLGFNTDSGST